MKLHYTPKMIKCSCCGEVKPETEFYRQAYTNTPMGQCKQCTNIKRGVVRHKKQHSKFVSKEKIRAMEVTEYALNDWRDAMLHFHGRCCYCGRLEGRAKADRFDREHLIPLSRGGKAVRQNICPACRPCNRGRGNRKLFAWYREQSFWDAGRELAIVQWLGYDAAVREGYDGPDITIDAGASSSAGVTDAAT